MKRTATVRSKTREVGPTGLNEVDRLSTLSPCTIRDYIAGVSAYVRKSSGLKPGPKKAAQIRLSSALARALADDLSERIPKLRERLVTHEQKVAGGLRTANADVSESHPLDGLRLAVELKPVNLAVGRAIWNRFGDIRTFAINIHLKFPFAVVGGVLVIPTYEETGTTAAMAALIEEEMAAEGKAAASDEEEQSARVKKDASEIEPIAPARRATTHLINRAIERFTRAGGRRSEADAPHLLEAIAVVVYDPDSGEIDVNLPAANSGLRWEEFIDALSSAYRARFED